MVEPKEVLYLPSGRIFILQTEDGYPIECTEMRDVSVEGKHHEEVRNTTDPRVIWKHLVPYEDKWLLTVSTQKGCTHNCKFCDVASLPFKGNLTCDEILEQVNILLAFSRYVTKCNKVKIGFARMGEPAWNVDNVLRAMEQLPQISRNHHREFRWLPCFNTILPKKANVLRRVIDFKERIYNGFLHLQISCNSTDEATRKELFGGADVVELGEIVETVNSLQITNRTVTLNFIVMDGVEISIDKLLRLGLNREKFAVKLIPLNATNRAWDNDLETYANYENMEDLTAFGDEFRKHGIPVVTDAIARCEEAGLCCGQLAQIFL